ncbi:hypothetical protein QBC98_005346 [Kitasatospora acidiphila]
MVRDLAQLGEQHVPVLPAVRHVWASAGRGRCDHSVVAIQHGYHGGPGLRQMALMQLGDQVTRGAQ